MDALEDVIERHLNGADFDAAATTIVRGYGPEVFGYLIALTRDEDRAHDVFSQCCEDLWRGLSGFRRDASARTWVYKLAWHAWLRHQRDAFRRRAQPISDTQIS